MATFAKWGIAPHEKKVLENVVRPLQAVLPMIVPFHKVHVTEQDLPCDLAKIYRSQNNLHPLFKPPKPPVALFTNAGGEQFIEVFMNAASDARARIVEDVMLQIAHFVTVLEMFDVAHQDLHFGNIFVERLDEEESYVIQPLKTRHGDLPRIVRPILYRVHVIDWDVAAASNAKPSEWAHKTFGERTPDVKAVSGEIKRKVLEHEVCDIFGKCNQFYRNRDWAIFLANTWFAMNLTVSATAWLPGIPDTTILGLLNGLQNPDSMTTQCREEPTPFKTCEIATDYLENITGAFDYRLFELYTKVIKSRHQWVLTNRKPQRCRISISIPSLVFLMVCALPKREIDGHRRDNETSKVMTFITSKNEVECCGRRGRLDP